MRPNEIAGLAVLTALALPPSMVQSGPTLCPFRLATGRPCPTCGMTSTWNSYAHFRLRESFALHPLGPLTFLGAAWVAFEGQRRPTPSALQSTPFIGVLAIVWLSVWLRRLYVSGSDRVATQ
jgi:hypothetical protein